MEAGLRKNGLPAVAVSRGAAGWAVCVGASTGAGAALGARLARYPVGGLVIGMVVGVQLLEVGRVFNGQGYLYSVPGAAFFAGVVFLPLVVLESLGRLPRDVAKPRGPGLLSRLLAGVPSLGEDEAEDAPPKGRPLPGMDVAGPPAA